MKSLKKLCAIAMIISGIGFVSSCKKMDNFKPGGTNPDGTVGPVVPIHGGLSLSLSAGPTKFDEVHFNIKEIQVYIAGKKESGWHTLVKEPKSYDLVQLMKEPAVIGAAAIPAGMPTFIRIIPADKNYVVLNGVTMDMKVMSERGVNIEVPDEYIVEVGQKTDISLHFDIQNSIEVIRLKDKVTLEMTPHIAVVKSDKPFELDHENESD